MLTGRDEDEGEREEWARRRDPRRKYTSSPSDYRSVIIVSGLTLSPGVAGQPHHHGHHASSHGSSSTRQHNRGFTCTKLACSALRPDTHSLVVVLSLFLLHRDTQALVYPLYINFRVKLFDTKNGVHFVRTSHSASISIFTLHTYVRQADRQTDRQAGRNTYTTHKFLTPHKTRDSKKLLKKTG